MHAGGLHFLPEDFTMTAFLDYLGPADSITVERAEGLSLPEGAGPATEHTRHLSPEHTVATVILYGMSEARLHALARLYPILAELPIPELPADQMDAVRDLLQAALQAASDGRADLDDLPELLQALRALGRLMLRG